MMFGKGSGLCSGEVGAAYSLKAQDRGDQDAESTGNGSQLRVCDSGRLLEGLSARVGDNAVAKT